MGAQTKVVPDGCRRSGVLSVTVAAAALTIAVSTAAALGRSPADTALYAQPGHPQGPAATIPAFGDRATLADGWAFEAWGSPDATRRTAESITSIAASPDGHEAWAVGAERPDGGLTLFHFDARGWRRCDPSGAEEPANASCDELSELHDRGLTLESVVSIEREDGGFEAVAVGWLPPPAGAAPDAVTAMILRYRDGRWNVEDAPADPTRERRYQLHSVAFASPEDGWAYGSAAATEAVFLRFRNGRWLSCAASTCDEGTALPQRRFTPPKIGPALYAAGGRVFLAGTRRVATVQRSATYPVILERRGSRWDSSRGLDPAGPGESPTPAQEASLLSFAVAETEAGEVEGWARTGPAEDQPSSTTLRLPPGGTWQPWAPSRRNDALRDRPLGAEVRAAWAGPGGAVMTTDDGPMLRYDTAENRWRVLPAPFDPSGDNPFTEADVEAVGPDGRGGLWVVHDGGGGGPYFHRYTDRPHRPVFDDAPQPLRGDRIRALDAAPDGAVWLAGDDGALARYDRVTGWSRHEIAGWDEKDGPAPQIAALAVAPDGDGVAVGEQGRIATFGPTGGEPASVRAAADLRAVDVAPDGSALAGGDAGALLWRPAGGDFRAADGPAKGARITGIALPTNDRAWIATDAGAVIAGRRAGGAWTWEEETTTPKPLRAIAVDAAGRGYAVGDGGTVLERAGDGDWRALALGVTDDFTAVALPPGGGEAALIGGRSGAIWTRHEGELQPARPADPVDGYAAFGGSRVSGLAVLPGHEPGQVEAWAAVDGPDLPGALLHHTSHPDDPLLNPVKPVEPLPDTPAARPDEVSFVAFGKSDCANADDEPCPGPSGTDAISDVISRRIVAEVKARGRRDGGPAFSVFTGDANDHGGDVTRASRPVLLNEWVDVVARPLDDAEIPTLGAIGMLDLAEVRECATNTAGLCKESDQATRTGANVFWRQAMARRVGQDGAREQYGDLRYRPVREDAAPPTPDVEVASGAPDPVPAPLPTGGARTHYAVDVVRGSRTLVRLVFVDNSLGSLRASDPLQQPPEPRGQLMWLDRVLRARPQGARAVVVSTSPSYVPERDVAAQAADDGPSLEDVVLKHRVSAVVAGRVGWNALYYALAPGLHCPAPGGAYPEHPPRDDAGCGRSSPIPAALPRRHLDTAVPFVISASAGGKLARESGDGYWHGYSVVRLDASGDPAKTIVEQRPILDWLVVTADKRRLRPGDRLTLEGVGREPMAADAPARFHRIDDPSITHRYDLLVADPDRPWLPLRDGDGDYVSLSERHPDCEVACVDRQSGEVTAGEGGDERVHAVGMLSAGGLAATYPLVIEPGRRRALPSPVGPTSALRAGPAAARPAPPSGASTPTSGAPASPASPASSAAPHLDLPGAPSLPPSAGGGAAPPPSPTPPSAPTASPPTAPPVGTAAGTTGGPTAAEVPRVSPVPPTAPKATPAPKVGVRTQDSESARAAIAGFEDESLDAAAEAVDPREDLLVDIAPAPALPPGAASTRRDHERPDLAMTALEGREQPSAWLRNAGYGGGLAVAALVLAGGWSTLRSRRRPAPALATTRHEGR